MNATISNAVKILGITTRVTTLIIRKNVQLVNDGDLNGVPGIVQRSNLVDE